MDMTAMFKLSYGLFVVTAREGEKDNGCITNTAGQVTDNAKPHHAGCEQGKLHPRYDPAHRSVQRVHPVGEGLL